MKNFRTKESIPLDAYGVVGIGSFNWDYIIPDDNLNRESGTIIELPSGLCYAIKDHEKTLLEIIGPYIPDSKGSLGGYRLIADDKHKSSRKKDTQTVLKVYKAYRLGTEVSRRPGGGIINLARDFIAMSSINFGIAALRGENSLEDLVDSAWSYYIPVSGQSDQGNLIIQANNARTIIRGNEMRYDEKISLNPDFPFKVGTVVINSTDNKNLVEAGIRLYLRSHKEFERVAGVIMPTPKMQNSYELIRDFAMPRGFIPIFNPTDILSYTGLSRKDDVEPDITYGRLLESLRTVRQEQKGMNQRMYLTLGEYGAIGVAGDGAVFRALIFEAKSKKNKTGAGDCFASAIVLYEHMRSLCQDSWLPVYKVVLNANAAAAVHLSGERPSKKNIWDAMVGKTARYQYLGNIGSLRTDRPEFQETLKQVGSKPVSVSKWIEARYT